MKTVDRFDYVIVGGGLQGCLLTHALAKRKPDAAVLLLERGDQLCGNHTWSFHESDIPPSARSWFDPLIEHRWPAYSVRFPEFTRRVTIPYATISSDRLRRATDELADRFERVTVRRGVTCHTRSDRVVELDGGEIVEAKLVVDCRGQAPTEATRRGTGYQVFLGREVELQNDWPDREPTMMRVVGDQSRGFEFLYELPLSRRRVLVEYTSFADQPECDEDRADELIRHRLAEVGESALRVVRTERGRLPMPYAAAAVGASDGVSGGYAGGWFHAATGYSMPLAIRFAETVAGAEPDAARAAVASLAEQHAFQRRFSRFLNRLLFRLVSPRHRWKIFRRFYRVLSEERIARFYAHRFNASDAARIVVGKPPSGLRPMRFAKSFFSPPRAATP